MRHTCVLLFLLLVGCVSRPPALPGEHQEALPWGAVSTRGSETPIRNHMSGSLNNALDSESALPDTDGDGIPNIAVLGLSGGGSNGAFAVGLLSGWTEHGTRPEFKIVTGVSTGALIATHAFLGSEYDSLLEEIYTSITDDQVFRSRNPLSVLYNDSLRDTSPLRKTIAGWIDLEILEQVAREHRRGRRLYVATTDLDGNRLIAWDLGAIAASDRPDRLKRYRDVLLASSSVPVAFPPVYFPVDINGETYWQMHVDGGASANIFFSGFMFDVQRAIEAHRLEQGAQVDFYLIVNSTLEPRPLDQPVKGNILSIAAASTWSMSWAAQSAQLARMFRIIHGLGLGYHLAGIPSDYPDPLDSSSFDPLAMSKLLEYSKAKAVQGYPWLDKPPGLDWREINPEYAPVTQQ